MAVEPLIDQPRPVERRPHIGRLTVLESLRRQFVIALLPVALLVAAAVALGLTRDPQYTSEARLNVGGLSLTQQSIEGYSHAVEQLAIAYARSIDATGVVRPTAKQAGVPRAEVADAISATPIPGSPIISVRATASKPRDAVRLADAAANSLVDYAVELNSGRQLSTNLLARYRSAASQFRRATQDLARAPQGVSRDALETRVDTARLKRDTLGFLYSQSQAGQATVHLVQQLAPAAAATSDRKQVLKDYIAAAVIAGLLIGVGLAVARANAVARRRLGAS